MCWAPMCICPFVVVVVVVVDAFSLVIARIRFVRYIEFVSVVDVRFIANLSFARFKFNFGSNNRRLIHTCGVFAKKKILQDNLERLYFLSTEASEKYKEY